MASIMIENLFKKTFRVTNHSKTLLQHFQDQNLDWMQACGAKGRCTTCMVIVKSGSEHLQDPTTAEQKYRQEGLLQPFERLACQAKINGDVVVKVPKEYQLPHVVYSEEV
jgi:2Fe-2S ferredoxin